jgi:hypothetical protein
MLRIAMLLGKKFRGFTHLMRDINEIDPHFLDDYHHHHDHYKVSSFVETPLI